LFQDIIENTNPALDILPMGRSMLGSLDLHSRDQNAFMTAKRSLNIRRYGSRINSERDCLSQMSEINDEKSDNDQDLEWMNILKPYNRYQTRSTLSEQEIQ
jgi:hypothetical protein